MRLSNRAKKRMRDKAIYCKATGDLKTACDLLHKVIQSDNKAIGLVVKKLVSRSYVVVPPKPRANNMVDNYNKGDYFYNELNLITLRA